VSAFPTERGCPFSPPEEFGVLREREPLSRMSYPDGAEGWIATRHAEVRAILADPRFSARNELHRSPVATDLGHQTSAPPGMFNKMDPPQHTKYRKLLTGYFTVRKMADFGATVERIVADHINSLLAMDQPVDLVAEFAEPVPSEAICALLGVPDGIRVKILDHMKTISCYRTTAKKAGWSMWALHSHVQQFVQTALAAPGEGGLIGQLAGSGALTAEELTHLTSVLLVGGHDTVTSMIGLAIFTLLEHPDQLTVVREDPSAIDNAVEELLRYLTISHLGAGRCAVEDVEISGTQVRAGETVTVVLASANRDPERFADPDDLDVTRSAQGHLAFGHGVHQCIGQHLARGLLRTSLRALITRLPGLRLAEPADAVPMGTDMIHYGPKRLRVSW
jgi:cytochrome P450